MSSLSTNRVSTKCNFSILPARCVECISYMVPNLSRDSSRKSHLAYSAASFHTCYLVIMKRFTFPRRENVKYLDYYYLFLNVILSTVMHACRLCFEKCFINNTVDNSPADTSPRLNKGHKVKIGNEMLICLCIL